MHFKLLAIIKMKSNHRHLKMAITFSGDISLNSGPVTRYSINEKSNKGSKI